MIGDAPPRWPVHSPLTELLHLSPFENWMQDWPLEVADAARLPEFCEFYEAEPLDRETQFALMQLIVFSLDEAISSHPGRSDETANRVEALLRRDFGLHFHTVNYWRCPNDERGFAVTPMMRRIWNDCYKSEHRGWPGATEEALT